MIHPISTDEGGDIKASAYSYTYLYRAFCLALTLISQPFPSNDIDAFWHLLKAVTDVASVKCVDAVIGSEDGCCGGDNAGSEVMDVVEADNTVFAFYDTA